MFTIPSPQNGRSNFESVSKLTDSLRHGGGRAPKWGDIHSISETIRVIALL